MSKIIFASSDTFASLIYKSYNTYLDTLNCDIIYKFFFTDPEHILLRLCNEFIII